MTAYINDPARQPNGWYIQEEEAEEAAQQLLQSEWAKQTFTVAIAQLQLARALLDSQEYDGRSALIQAGVTETSLDDIEYLHDVGRRFIPNPGYVAWCELRGIVHQRIGRPVMGSDEHDFDSWYAHMGSDDIGSAIDAMDAAIAECQGALPLLDEVFLAEAMKPITPNIR